MKTKLLGLAITLLVGSQVNAQDNKTTTTTTTTQTTKTEQAGSTKYFYYPESNVYYNESSKTYSYYDPSTSTWVSNAELPTTIVIKTDAEKAPIMYNGTDVWKENVTHQKKYRKAMKKLSKS